jgi:hypothetical protein
MREPPQTHSGLERGDGDFLQRQEKGRRPEAIAGGEVIRDGTEQALLLMCEIWRG